MFTVRIEFLALLIAALLCAACNSGSNGRLKVSGRVEFDRVYVGSKIGGRVAEVRYDEGDAVERDAVIVALESQELNAQLAQARAMTAQAQAQLDLLLAGSRAEDVLRAKAVVRARQAELELRRRGFRDEEVKEAEAQLAAAQSGLELARKEFERAQELLKSGTIEQREFDSRRSAFETARAAAQIAEQQLQLRRSGSRPEEIAMAEAQLAQSQAELDRLINGARPEEIAAARAALQAAEANVAQIETQLRETSISAPAAATVETLDLKPGDLLKPGQTVAALDLRGQPWVRCYVPENQLGYVKPGNKVSITIDTFPGRKFSGIIRRVNSEAEFTPRNAQTTEKRAELVFEMKVDVTGDAQPLRAGMYADVLIGIALE